VNIAQLLHKLRIISNVEIVVPLLPEMLGIANQAPRYSLLQRLQLIGQRISFRFAEQQVDMLRHDYVPVNVESVTAAHSLRRRLEDSAACVCCKQATAMVTAECDEMTLATVVKPCWSPWHEGNLVCQADRVCDV